MKPLENKKGVWMAYITKVSGSESGDDELHTPYKGTAREFVGDVTAKRLIWAGDSPDVELLAVWFSAGARTRAHIHDADQVLHIVEGTCAFGDENGVTLVPVGNVILVPKGTWHWHGATPSEPMMHISIRKMGNSTNWDVDQKDWAERYERIKSEG